MHTASGLLLACALATLGSTTTAHAYNPILPGWEYIPDGEPRIFGNRVYLYGSHDRAGSTEYCDYKYRVWSAPLADLNSWTDHGVSFATRDQEGHAADVPWSSNHLYAPDVIENHGKYWLYAYVVGAPCAVAVSESPAGPFKLVSAVNAPAGSSKEFGGWGQYIDPGVLVDDDGKVYLYWGYKDSHMAQLDPATMVDVLPGTYQADIIPREKPFSFFEGVSPRKINGLYYMVYAAGDSLVYATASAPTGAFTYRGAIVRNRGDNPGGNIHGGLAQLNGQWYIFYHRHSHNTHFSRRACVERITIEADGTIAEVEQTSLGFKESLDPFVETPAEVTCVLRGGPYIIEFDRNTRAVINIKNDAVVGYKYFDFGPAPEGAKLTFTAAIRSGKASGQLSLWTGATSTAQGGVHLGSVAIDYQGQDPAAWCEITATVDAPTGRQALYLCFISPDGAEILCDLKSFRFHRP